MTAQGQLKFVSRINLCNYFLVDWLITCTKFDLFLAACISFFCLQNNLKSYRLILIMLSEDVDDDTRDSLILMVIQSGSKYF